MSIFTLGRLTFLTGILGIAFTARVASADIGVIINENFMQGTRFITGGHLSLYISNACADTPFSIRMCEPGESPRGIVVNRYEKISDQKQDWIAVPLIPFLYGVEDVDQAPLLTSGRVQKMLSKRFYKKHLETIIPPDNSGLIPSGSFNYIPGQTFKRDVISLSMESSIEEESKLVDAINARTNITYYNLFKANCSDFVSEILTAIFEPKGGLPKLKYDQLIKTPKGVASRFWQNAKASPGRALFVSRFGQIPSDDYLRSKRADTFADILFNKVPLVIGLWSPVALVAGKIYLNQIDMRPEEELERHFNPEFAQLERDANVLRRALSKISRNRNSWNSLEHKDLGNRLAAIVSRQYELQQEYMGKPAEWDAYEKTFKIFFQELIDKGYIADGTKIGESHKSLLAKSSFIETQSQGLVLVHQDGEQVVRAPLSPQNILSGDPKLALLILAARIGWDISAKSEDRPLLKEFRKNWSLLLASRHANGL